MKHPTESALSAAVSLLQRVLASQISLKSKDYERRRQMDFNAGQFDIAVIGAGHAGIEAALASARLGMKTVCFTINLDAVGNMPCNPAIGGTGKGPPCAGA